MHHWGNTTVKKTTNRFRIVFRNRENGKAVSITGPSHGIYEAWGAQITEEDLNRLAERFAEELRALGTQSAEGKKR